MIDLIITNKKNITYTVFFTPKITDHSIITMDLQETKEKKGYLKHPDYLIIL